MIESGPTQLPLATSGCSCCAPASNAMADTGGHSAGAAQTGTDVVTYQVEGMTCGHCVDRVVNRVSALDAVDGVRVEPAVHGISSVIVTGRASTDAVRAAIEADYRVL